METNPKPWTVYLSGPMRDREDFNYPAFDAAARRLRAIGVNVINPAESFGGRTDLPIETYLRFDIAAILTTADSVQMLEGWEDSPGARLEKAVAEAIGLPVAYPEVGE